MAVDTTTNDNTDPSCPSSDYKAMKPTWDKIRAILGGLHDVRKCGITYLPKYEGETEAEYTRRLSSTSWRPEFEDGIRNLSAKPFQQDITLADGANEQIKTLSENIDGQGNNLTQFSKTFFDEALAMGVTGILVDYPTMAPNLTLADEKQANAKPYWCMICPENIIAAYFDTYGGEVYLSHLRIKECYSKRDSAFGEVLVERVRVFDRTIINGKGFVTWELWETVENTDSATKDSKKYVLVRQDTGNISLEYIPFVFFFTGKKSDNYRVRPPLNSLADMQIELYQKLSNKNEIQTFAGSPMLKVLGVRSDDVPSEDDGKGNKTPAIFTGPKRVIVLAPGGDGSQPDADFIQPQAQNMTELREDINDIIENMRRLAMQPITDKAGNPTATGQAIDQAKAHSTLQSWALGLKDALEQAFLYTAQWMGLQNVEPEVQVFTDWGVDAEGVAELTLLQKDVMAGNISRRTYWNECKRRDTLSQDFDADAEEEAIAEEALNAPEQNIDPDTGKPVQQQQEAA